MDKRNRILTLLLAAQLIIIVVVYYSGAGRSEAAFSLVAGVDQEQITGLSITDDEKNSITLEKDDKGWFAAKGATGVDKDKRRSFKSTSKLRYPVEQTKANTLAKKLANLRSSYLVTRTKSSHDRLKVGDDSFNRKIEITTAAGTKEVVYLGAAPNYKAIYVRISDEPEVYLAKDLALWEAPAESTSWWPGNYLKVPADKLVGISLKNRQGSFTLEKGEKGLWHFAGDSQALSAEAVREFLDRIKEITLADIVTGPVDLKKKAAAVLVFKTADRAITLEIWEKDKKNVDHLVKSSEKPFYARVGSYEAEHILNKKRADFLPGK